MTHEQGSKGRRLQSTALPTWRDHPEPGASPDQLTKSSPSTFTEDLLFSHPWGVSEVSARLNNKTRTPGISPHESDAAAMLLKESLGREETSLYLP